MRGLIPLLVCLSIVLIAGSALATVIHVPGDQPTIQAGLDAASSGDMVLVACGVYYEHDIALVEGVHLRSETGEPGCVTVDAERLGRVFVCIDQGPGVVVEGFTITGGLAEGGSMNMYGGGFFCQSSDPRILNCHFTGNEAEYRGGGLYCWYSPAEIENCLFTQNVSASGGSGGGMGCGRSDFTMTDCTFLSNEGTDGAGLWISDASPTLLRCLFANNDAMFWGGGIVCYNDSAPLIRQCTFVQNEAYEGGGAWVWYNSNPVFENCIVANSLSGWGIFSEDTCNPTFLCCDVFSNTDGNYGGDLPDQTGINGNISEDPLFCDLEGGDFHLHSDSPCAWANNPDCGYVGALPVGCGETVGIDSDLPAMGQTLRVVPNPSTGEVKIDFQLPESGPFSVNVFDVSGRSIRNLFEGTDPMVYAGEWTVSWDGRNDQGQRVTPGTYFARVVTADRTETQRIVLLR